jgi:hypothetical protein
MLRIVAGVGSLICDGLRWLWLTLRSTSAVEAENLFLRRQLALYLERGVKPRRIDSITRIALTILSGFFDWRDAYWTNVIPNDPRRDRPVWMLASMSEGERASHESRIYPFLLASARTRFWRDIDDH